MIIKHTTTEKTETTTATTEDRRFEVAIQTMEGSDTYIRFSSTDSRFMTFAKAGEFKIVIDNEDDDACFIDFSKYKTFRIFLHSSTEARAIAEFLKEPLYNFDENLTIQPVKK